MPRASRVVTVLALLAVGAGATAASSNMAPTAGVPVLSVDLSARSRAFDGVGGISGGGATSRLLVDYPNATRSALLDLLFKPQWGASLTTCKVEIGGDKLSTQGTEASHMHTEADLDLNRGYEWWVMREAKARNPNITLYGLPWAFPRWVAGASADSADPSPWTDIELPIKYVTNWVKGAHDVHGLDIDYVGSWNESPYNTSYLKALRRALDAEGLHGTKIVAADDGGWAVAADILADPELAAAVSAIGSHYPGARSTPQAVQTGKPLWASEAFSTYDDLRGAGCWARVLNQGFVRANITSTLSWNLIASYYYGLPWRGDGLLAAAEPWSGHWDSSRQATLWATAHTTQFASPGWRYLAQGRGSGLLAGGGSYVTLTGDSASGSHFSMVIEKMAWAHSQCVRPPIDNYATVPETLKFKLQGGGGVAAMGVTKLYAWRTQLAWDGPAVPRNDSTLFARAAPVAVAADGTFSVDVAVDEIVTLTTCATCGRKGAVPASPPSQPFPAQYSDDFDGYEVSAPPRYFTDEAGSFEVVQAAGASHGRVLRQAVPKRPLTPASRDTVDFVAHTVIGDVHWRDFGVQSDVLVEDGGAAAFIGGRTRFVTLPGIYLSVWPSNGTWALSASLNVTDSSPASLVRSGPLLPGTATGQWLTLRLEVVDGVASGWVGGAPVFAGVNTSAGASGTLIPPSGWVSVGTSGLAEGDTANWTLAQFDNFAVNGTRARCRAPTAGTALTLGFCSPADASVNQWAARADGGPITLLASASSESSLPLCVATQDDGGVELAACNASAANQQFRFRNSSSDPWASLHNGMRVLTGNGGCCPQRAPMRWALPTATVAPCASAAGDTSQLFAFSGSADGTVAGRISTVDGAYCVEGACGQVSPGCSAVQFAACDAARVEQLFTHDASQGAFRANSSAAAGGCLDVWGGGRGPNVGIYRCDGEAGQQWDIVAAAHVNSDAVRAEESQNRIRSRAGVGDRCLASVGAPAGALPAMYSDGPDGPGQITAFGGGQATYCMAADTCDASILSEPGPGNG